MASGCCVEPGGHTTASAACVYIGTSAFVNRSMEVCIMSAAARTPRARKSAASWPDSVSAASPSAPAWVTAMTALTSACHLPTSSSRRGWMSNGAPRCCAESSANAAWLSSAVGNSTSTMLSHSWASAQDTTPSWSTSANCVREAATDAKSFPAAPSRSEAETESIAGASGLSRGAGGCSCMYGLTVLAAVAIAVTCDKRACQQWAWMGAARVTCQLLWIYATLLQKHCAQSVLHISGAPACAHLFTQRGLGSGQLGARLLHAIGVRGHLLHELCNKIHEGGRGCCSASHTYQPQVEPKELAAGSCTVQ